MLKTAATFPFPGSAAFLRGPTGTEPQPCRILQRRADGQVTIAIDERFKTASSTRTVTAADLCATANEASAPVKRRRKAA
ncbi:hypothetical protein B0I00_1868 [Novosphingobium kunmingense]|uniref:Uncharacterized protein n=1 Tax=Novosphingobium kunmingense TaxID=1211806 RepID=A0A2N0HL39_9SPHN|nr:hypothetical protein [Novosphingobium kunmingense]PKB19629.1 hypothetical protein B0I00_1868 [Novosphingobium kunmingense]